ncbi:hypothetical protein [Paraburkholderia acidisoli]|uniref:hypothetical protein n=1 Tax=Paraburkholderia acidisoli TaxID=2571748 RepID=UPI001E367A0C|nr:hypothetical protein [Paraburkholderia acidisoli]
MPKTPASPRIKPVAMAALCLAAAALSSFATEGGVGRPITGQQVTPYGGVVPPTDDWIVSWATIYYEGSLGASKSVAVAGRVTAGHGQ